MQMYFMKIISVHYIREIGDFLTSDFEMSKLIRFDYLSSLIYRFIVLLTNQFSVF